MLSTITFAHFHKLSLSTQAKHTPQVCPRLPFTPSLHNPSTSHLSPALPHIAWKRVLQATCVAGLATLLSQLACTPLDTRLPLCRAVDPNFSSNLFLALLSIVRRKQILTALSGFHLHTLKRLPTKIVKVALSELGIQLASSGDTSPL